MTIRPTCSDRINARIMQALMAPAKVYDQAELEQMAQQISAREGNRSGGARSAARLDLVV